MARSWSATEIHRWKKEGRPAAGATDPDLFSASALSAWFKDIVVSTEAMCEQQAVEALKESAAENRQRVFAQQTQRSGGIRPLLRTVVDGRVDEALTSIKASSIIVLVWNYTPEITQKTREAWVQRSPRRTGEYIEGILTFVDMQPAGSQLITVDTREVRLVASVPYARRLEVGKDDDGGPFVKQVAPHIAEETALVAKRKFGDLADISFQYMDLSDAYALKNPKGFRRVRGLLQTDVRYPTIVILPRW